jgi:hypothetical protein
VQQHLPQQVIQRTGLSVQAPSSSNNVTLKVATVVRQIITELSEIMSEKDNHYKNGTELNETKWLIEFIGRLES